MPPLPLQIRWLRHLHLRVRWGCQLHLLEWGGGATCTFLSEVGMPPKPSWVRWGCHLHPLRWGGDVTCISLSEVSNWTFFRCGCVTPTFLRNVMCYPTSPHTSTLYFILLRSHYTYPLLYYIIISYHITLHISYHTPHMPYYTIMCYALPYCATLNYIAIYYATGTLLSEVGMSEAPS